MLKCYVFAVFNVVLAFSEIVLCEDNFFESFCWGKESASENSSWTMATFLRCRSRTGTRLINILLRSGNIFVDFPRTRNTKFPLDQGSMGEGFLEDRIPHHKISPGPGQDFGGIFWGAGSHIRTSGGLVGDSVGTFGKTSYPNS